LAWPSTASNLADLVLKVLYVSVKIFSLNLNKHCHLLKSHIIIQMGLKYPKIGVIFLFWTN
jgi:hypothetical protein